MIDLVLLRSGFVWLLDWFFWWLGSGGIVEPTPTLWVAMLFPTLSFLLP